MFKEHQKRGKALACRLKAAFTLTFRKWLRYDDEPSGPAHSYLLPRMKSIVISSMLAVIGCVALSIAVALLAASPNLNDEATRQSSAAGSAQGAHGDWHAAGR